MARATFLVMFVAAVLVSFAGTAARADAPPPPPFVIIVNTKNPTSGSSREFFADAFLKKTTRWEDGEPIRPVDLGPTSPARRSFSDKVLERSVAAVRSYWQQRIFSGRELPPPELASDDAVVDYVQRNRGAVGYVSGSARVRDVKSVTIR